MELTEEQEIILDAWFEFSYETKKGYYHGGLSTLENIYYYLLKNKIIDENGNQI